MNKCCNGKIDSIFRYTLYPFLLATTIGYVWLALEPGSDLKLYHGFYTIGLVLVMVVIESLHPLRTSWKMTKWTLLKRDLPFIILGGTTIGIINYVAGLLIVEYGIPRGTSHESMGLLQGFVLALLTVDFIWYWVHRFSHEAKGKLGQFMWRVHVAHHLPRQVYVLMHGVAHPLNTIIVRAIFTLPLFFLGFSMEVIYLVNVIVGLQGLVSHFNIDIRAGWLNYFIMGTELHRYHHSANPGEGKNYGGVVTLWDQLFGTFIYRPGIIPKQLGVERPENYPSDQSVIEVLKLPFSMKRV